MDGLTDRWADGLSGWIDRWMDGRTDRQTDEWMDGRSDGWTGRWADGRMDGGAEGGKIDGIGNMRERTMDEGRKEAMEGGRYRGKTEGR